MRDLIRNYKKILAGGNRDSDSDGESQPLASSSYTSSSSFGTFFSPPTPTSDSDEDNETVGNTTHKSDGQQVNSKFDRLYSKSEIEKYTSDILAHNFDNPDLSLYTVQEYLYNKPSYAKVPNYMNDSKKLPKKDLNNLITSITSEHITFMDYIEPKKHTHNSLVTIFAIWNTTMGSSLLAMSWGIQMAGLLPSIIINIMVAALCLYTCYMLLSINERHGMPGKDIEVHHLCKDLLGRWAEILAKIFSIVVLLGANIVYMILMSNFLYNFVYFLYGFLVDPEITSTPKAVLCPKESNVTFQLNDTNLTVVPVQVETLFDRIWDLNSTVPIYLSVIMFGVLNFKSPTFFTKFNSLGTISVLYLIIFVAVKASNWGINIPDWTSELYLKPTFTALSGMLSLSYFIHNIIISIMRNNKCQENNGRDLTIAFGLVTFTYLFIGILFYISFPLAKSCIEDNILNNFSKNDTLTIIARILLLFQLFTVFPLISFMLRNDILGNINQIFKNYRFGDFTYGRVMILNTVLLFICVMFACFLPKIGTLIRYTGALSGMVYIFMLPNLLKLSSLRKSRELTTCKAFWHVLIIVAGTLNLLSQFFIDD
ncbi:sodium-coupled neutral amino acid transporter 9-like [Sitophilus oryzae]|uniref:Sodium-coupled neutral amino acid transporter 9-like n=1 Tax=Sitophilus oryzae TaxID=7048 RepID=A0A6J2YIB2_SITOR|nr:sodium-coupled neutral amino acid transporter 9-like [Sitophilus oryzae]